MGYKVNRDCYQKARSNFVVGNFAMCAAKGSSGCLAPMSLHFSHSLKPRLPLSLFYPPQPCPEHDTFSPPIEDEFTFIMDADKSIGIIGMGDMGKMYARRLSDAGWK